MALNLYFAYVATCIVIVIVPGPIVTLVVANSLRHGPRAGLSNIAGAQLSFTLMIGIVLLLGVTAMAIAFVSDSAYALLAGRAAGLLSARRVRLVSRASGFGDGAWLALSRSR